MSGFTEEERIEAAARGARVAVLKSVIEWHAGLCSENRRRSLRSEFTDLRVEALGACRAHQAAIEHWTTELKANGGSLEG